MRGRRTGGGLFSGRKLRRWPLGNGWLGGGGGRAQSRGRCGVVFFLLLFLRGSRYEFGEKSLAKFFIENGAAEDDEDSNGKRPAGLAPGDWDELPEKGFGDIVFDDMEGLEAQFEDIDMEFGSVSGFEEEEGGEEEEEEEGYEAYDHEEL